MTIATKLWVAAVLIAMQTHAGIAQQRALSVEGEARKSAHDYLFSEYATGKQLKFVGEGSSRALDEIVISTQPVKVRGDVLLTLPEGSQRVASMFRYIVLRGEGLDQLEGLVMLPYAAGSNLAVSTKQPDIYRVKVAAMPVPADSMPSLQIKSQCKAGATATITEIAFNSQGKLAATFDDIAYRNLGSEFPRQSVKVRIDLQRELSIGGHVDLEREKFCRYYAAPGNLHESFERWAAERNFLPGRQIFKFQPAVVAGYSPNQPRLTEHPSKPGAADLSFFDRYDSSGPTENAIEPFQNIKFAMCFNDYPEFMSIQSVGRGTPLIEHVDFYSHHFYEDIGSLGAWHRRQSNYTNYLLGRLETILDMFRAHMHETNNVKPMLITECGSLQPGRGPSDYWLRIRTYSAYLHKFMQRPDELDLTVPFAFLAIPWNPESGDAAFIPKKGKPNHSPLQDCTSTPLANLFELWRDFDGHRLPVSFDHPFLDVTAVHRDKRLQLAITNMNGRRLSIDIAGLSDSIPATSVSQRRLFYRDGEVIYEDAVLHADTSAIPVDVEETTIVTIEMDRPLETVATVDRKTWYAAATAVKSVEVAESDFQIKADHFASLETATLAVGVHRTGGLGGPLSGTFNGQRFQGDPEWANELQHLFATIEIDIPVDQIRGNNEIRIDARDGLTITSVHLTTETDR